MAKVRILRAAAHRLDDIYRFTRDRWSEAQADTYLRSLFAAFEAVAGQKRVSRPIPAAFGVSGYVFRHENHFVYWRYLGNGDIGIVTILHARMHQIERFRDDFEKS